MWVTKFQYTGDTFAFGRLCKKYNIVATGYNLSSYEKGKEFLLTFAAKFYGNPKDTKNAIRELKKNNIVIRLEEKNNFVLLTIKEEELFKPFSSNMFIYISPALIDKGRYTFHIASWDRKEIEKLLSVAEKFKDFKLFSFKEEIIDNISFVGVNPNLTEKQKSAYELAVSNGYYYFPKKITLHKLAEMSEVSYSTFQQHLSYAEKKLGDAFVGKNTTVINR